MTVGVVVTDTFGRPWRTGLVDVAIGLAGIEAMDDLRGETDAYGNRLEMTVTAVADELASAGELVKGKLAGVPVAVIRGLGALVSQDDGDGARRCSALRPRTCSASGRASSSRVPCRSFVHRRIGRSGRRPPRSRSP